MNVADPATFDAGEVGATLRDVRLAMPRELVDVANDLRIRHVYLQAIEDGRLGDLPGPAYTTGFLRAYGDYLGLNGRDIVDRFRAAGGASSGRTDLHPPRPVQEGRLPTGSVLLLAALLAVGAYGGWYYMASSDDDPVERVSALPDQLISIIGEDAKTKTPETGDSGINGTATHATANGENVVIRTPLPTTGANGTTANGSVIVPAIRQVQRGRRLELKEHGGTVTASTDDGAPATVAANGRVKSDPVGVTAQPTSGNAFDRSAMVAPLAGGDMVPLGQHAPGTESAKIAARIVLQANTDSWLEVRAGDADPVYSGLLRQGDSYSVPEQPGLTLMTGNAGGIDILVDGKAIPKLGPSGAVKRDVVLDPDRLLGFLTQ